MLKCSRTRSLIDVIVNIGLFPASFVTGDLSAAVDTSASASAGVTQANAPLSSSVAIAEPAGPVAPDKTRIERCLELLNNEDPTDIASPPPEELTRLECTHTVQCTV